MMLAAVKEEIREFLNMSSLHGVKFVLNRNNIAERVLWIMVCCAALLGTLLVAGTIWTEFRDSPTQTIVEDPSYPVWNIDFPALTICNLNKVQRSRAQRLLPKILGDNVDNATESVFMDSLLALSLMRYPYYHHPLLFVKRGNKKLMDFSGHNISNIMWNVMAKHNDIFGTCYWKGREISCYSIFRTQVTEEGYCYSFNSKSSRPPDAFDIDSPPFKDGRGHIQPWRNNAAGKTTGLEIFFKSAEEEYLPNDERIPGYNLIVHHSNELPDVSRGIFLPRSSHRVTLLAVTATRVRANSALKRLATKERKCHLSGDVDEVQSVYCWTHCRILTIVKLCKCVPYFGVHWVWIPGTPQCSMKDILCLSAYNTKQRNIRPPPGSKGFRKTDLDIAIDCTCPPSCSSTTYKTELITQQRIDPFPYDDYAYLDFYFKDLEVVSYVRDIKFGFLDLIVSFGGMAGLFLGFSLVSAVEIIYYSSRALIRALTSYRQAKHVRDMDQESKTQKLQVQVAIMHAKHNAVLVKTTKEKNRPIKPAWDMYTTYYP